jgi:hypothetical protein
MDATVAHIAALVLLVAWLVTLPFRSRLAASERRYRLLFDSNPAPMWVFDDETLNFLGVNEAAVAHYGYSRDEFLSMSILDIRPPEDVPGFLETRRNAKPGRRSWGPHKHVRKDGTLIDVEVVTDSIRFSDRPARLVLVHDVTARRSLEAQLRQVQRMESVGMLAGGVAHDFNNILTAMSAHTEFLLEAIDPDDPRHEDAKQIRQGVARATNLTRQLLAFGRKQILKPAVLHLNTVVSQMHDMLRRLVGEDIELVVTLAHDLAPVLADPTQIEQVLLNLVVNARDAMPKGGVLIIETKNVDVDAAAAKRRTGLTPGRYVNIAVTDTGVGMTKDVQARIFEPFFTTKDVGRGTGLGLSTVYGIVKQSSGYIYVTSEPNRGSTFDVFLPRVEENAMAVAGEDAATLLPRGTETILLVEDEPAVRAVASRILSRQGYRVLEAHDGHQALDLARTHDGSLHLLLTDAVMPGLGGADVARKIRGLRRDVKVLFMSGYTEDEIIRRQILMDPNAFLEKPFTTVSLLKAVRTALGHQDHKDQPAVA